MTSLLASSSLPSSGPLKHSHQTSKGGSPYLSPSRKTATINFPPPSIEADASDKGRTYLDGRKDSTIPTRKLSYTAGIAEEKEELLSLLEDIPPVYQSIHHSYTPLPWAYKIYLAVDRSEPSEMARAESSMPSNSDPVDDESRDKKEGCSQLQDTILPSSLSLMDRRKIYQMVHSALPLTESIDQLLEEAKFYCKNKHLYCHEKLVRFMTYNFLQNKCSVKPPMFEEGTTPESYGLTESFVQIAEALWKSRVKLSGAFAKLRVQCGAVDLTGLMTGAQKQSRAVVRSLTQHARVLVPADGQPEECMAAVYKQLRMKNFFRAGTEEQLAALSEVDPRYRQAFSTCVHCEDRFVALAPGVHVEELELVKAGNVVPQDLPSLTALQRLKREIGAESEYDVLLTHFNNGTEAFHLAAMLAPKGGQVFACGMNEDQLQEFVKRKEKLNADNLILLPTPFEQCQPDDTQFAKVNLILCNPPCSLAAVASPVEFIMQEGDHLAVPLLTPERGSVGEGLKYQSGQKETLEHALTFRGCTSYVYFVRSHLQCETDDVIRTAVKATNKREKQLSSAASLGKKEAQNKPPVPSELMQFEEQSSQFMSFLSNEQAKSCDLTYGYFMSFIRKKVLTPPAPKSVIQRAIDKGLLTPFEASDFTTSSSMKIHKPKKYKHHYLKPTRASEARCQQLKEGSEFEVTGGK